MRFKEVMQVTFMAALPLFALELLAVWRTHRNRLRNAKQREPPDPPEPPDNSVSDGELESPSLDGTESEQDKDERRKSTKRTTTTSKKCQQQDKHSSGDYNNNKAEIQDALFFPEDDKKPPWLVSKFLHIKFLVLLIRHFCLLDKLN